MILKNSKGFTLVELLASLAILLIAMTIITGIFSSVLKMNNSAKDNYSSQSIAQIVMQRIQAEITYANSITIFSSIPVFTAVKKYIYPLNGSLMMNSGATTNYIFPDISTSQSYSCNLNFKKSSSKSVTVTVSITNNGMELYNLETNILINNLISASVGGAQQGNTIEYTIPNQQTVLVTFITVSSSSNTITTANGTLQMIATITPANAAYTWSVAHGTGSATITSSGLLTALSDGTVTVTAKANDGSGVFGTIPIDITS